MVLGLSLEIFLIWLSLRICGIRSFTHGASIVGGTSNLKISKQQNTMVTLRFTYHEIIDMDTTGIDVVVFSDQQPAAAFRNYVPESLNKEIYANQSEDFQLPDLRTALSMFRSNPSYREYKIEDLIG